MSEKATITAMREWLKTCPLIAEEQSENGAAFRISGLSPEPVVEFSIEDSPTDPVTAVFFSGRNLAKSYIFVSRRDYSEAQSVQIANSGFFEQLTEWVLAQNDRHHLPRLDGRKEALRVSVTSSGYIVTASAGSCGSNITSPRAETKGVFPMTVTEAVKLSGLTPSAAYTGVETTDDFLLAVQTEASQTDVKSWVVCADHVREHSGALNASTTDNTYIRTGPVTTKGSVQRTLSIQGDRYVGDAFQDFLLSHKIAFGSGQSVVVPYVYFSLRTGKGEKGEGALILTSDVGGSAGANATFAADFKGIGTPAEFDYNTAVAG